MTSEQSERERVRERREEREDALKSSEQEKAKINSHLGETNLARLSTVDTMIGKPGGD